MAYLTLFTAYRSIQHSDVLATVPPLANSAQNRLNELGTHYIRKTFELILGLNGLIPQCNNFTLIQTSPIISTSVRYSIIGYLAALRARRLPTRKLHLINRIAFERSVPIMMRTLCIVFFIFGHQGPTVIDSKAEDFFLRRCRIGRAARRHQFLSRLTIVVWQKKVATYWTKRSWGNCTVHCVSTTFKPPHLFFQLSQSKRLSFNTALVWIRILLRARRYEVSLVRTGKTSVVATDDPQYLASTKDADRLLPLEQRG